MHLRPEPNKRERPLLDSYVEASKTLNKHTLCDERLLTMIDFWRDRLLFSWPNRCLRSFCSKNTSRGEVLAATQFLLIRLMQLTKIVKREFGPGAGPKLLEFKVEPTAFIRQQPPPLGKAHVHQHLLSLQL